MARLSSLSGVSFSSLHQRNPPQNSNHFGMRSAGDTQAHSVIINTSVIQPAANQQFSFSQRPACSSRQSLLGLMKFSRVFKSKSKLKDQQKTNAAHKLVASE